MIYYIILTNLSDFSTKDFSFFSLRHRGSDISKLTVGAHLAIEIYADRKPL